MIASAVGARATRTQAATSSGAESQRRDDAARWLAWVMLAALCAATVAVYWPVRGHAFLNYDDDFYITRNAALGLGLGADGMRWAFTTTHGANWFPLTWLSLLADVQVYGLVAKGILSTNVILHVLATAALFLALWRLTQAPGRSAFVAGVFALHPLHVESVAWAASRKDVLSGLLFMLVLAAYTAYARAPSLVRYLPVAVLLALGLMAKPTLVTLPFVLLLLDAWPLRRLQDPAGRIDRSRLRRALLEKTPLLVLAAAASAVTYLVQRSGGAVAAGEGFSPRARIANALLTYVAYLRQAVWPEGLAVFYPHRGEATSWWAAAGALVLLSLATFALLRGWQARPGPAVGWLWYLGTLVPVIGLVQVGQQARADRYTYLPLIGVALAAAWGLAEPLARLGRRVPALVAAVAMAALALLTAGQVRVWRDSATLFAHALGVTGENAVARLNLGIALLDEGRAAEAQAHIEEAVRLHPGSAEGRGALAEAWARQGRVADAREAFAAALRLDPTLSRVHNGFGRLLAEQGETGQAIVHLREAIALDPAYAEPYNNLGAIRFGQGEPGDALEYFRKAVALDPAYAEAHANWGRVHLARGEAAEAAERFRIAAALGRADGDVLAAWGLALSRTGDFAAAEKHLREAIAVRPDDGLAHSGLALALANQSRLAEALPHFEKASRLQPRDADTLTSWGKALDGLSRSEEAIARYRAAIAAEPTYADAHNALGMALGDSGRLDEAAHHFRQAVAIRPDLAAAWNNWGLVLARQGRLDDAIRHFRAAVARDASYADAHNNLGVFLARRGRLDEAMAAFEQALRADPSHAGARENRDRIAGASAKGR